MNRKACTEENAIVRSARTGRLDKLSQAHIQNCAGCRDAVQAVSYMVLVANLPGGESLPEPSLLWWRAELAQRQTQAQRAQRPLLVIETLTAVISLIAIAGGFAWIWLTVGDEFPEWLLQSWAQLSSAALPQSLPMFASIFAIAGVLAFSAYPLLVEE